MSEPLVSIVTINYNSTNLTLDFLESVKNCTYKNVEIFVVDNQSTIKPTVIKEKYPDVNLILSDKNLGFAGGNNLAIKQSKGEFIFLLNNDTEVANGFLEPIVNLMLSNHTIGIASSKLVYAENPTLIQFAGSSGINLFTGRGFAIGQKEKDNEKFDKNYETSLAHGAAMLVRRNVFEQVGLMAELFFLYYEEVDFCERVKRAGFKIWYCGQSKVFHKESMSIGKDNPLKVYYLTRNRLIFTKRNTFGVQKYIAILFYYFVAVPKGILKYALANEIKLLKAFVKGALWNLKNANIYDNNLLNIYKD